MAFSPASPPAEAISALERISLISSGCFTCLAIARGMYASVKSASDIMRFIPSHSWKGIASTPTRRAFRLRSLRDRMSTQISAWLMLDTQDGCRDEFRDPGEVGHGVIHHLVHVWDIERRLSFLRHDRCKPVVGFADEEDAEVGGVADVVVAHEDEGVDVGVPHHLGDLVHPVLAQAVPIDFRVRVHAHLPPRVGVQGLGCSCRYSRPLHH